MKTYLVGGAIRDQLLDIPVKDRDWVVVGSSPEELASLGYQQVGADFPVFLHPKSKEEYALARTERKSGSGYKGFSVEFDSEVTLEEDLRRRDLTINAIAKADDGTFIDPFQGIQDLNNRVLRHVSDAFREDPLRVLRIARFAARFHHLGFTIAKETQYLLIEMSNSGELEHLVPERVWSEMSRALLSKTPSVYFQTLKQSNALKVVFPELNQLFGVPQPMKWHPEIDTGIHTLKALDAARKHSEDITVLFSTLCHDLGKGLTPEEKWPSHQGHEKLGADLINKVSKNNKWPTKCSWLAEQVAQFHTHCHKIRELKASSILSLLEKLKAFRQPENVRLFALSCEADARGRSGFENIDYPQSNYLLSCLQTCSGVQPKRYIDQGYSGKQLGEAIRIGRLEAIKEFKRTNELT